jgi:hypothetical protein
MKPVAVDLRRRDHANRERARARYDPAEELLALLDRELLRIVQACERTNAVIAEGLIVEQNSGDDERPGEAAASGLVDPCDEA